MSRDDQGNPAPPGAKSTDGGSADLSPPGQGQGWYLGRNLERRGR